MENTIIVGILLILLVIALLRAKKHFKGGCCGSGSTTIRDKKTLTQPAIGEKQLTIEGLCCENCAIRLENALNRLEGVLCRVSLKKKTARVTYSQEISDEVLIATVERMGYKVTGIS